MESTTSQIEAAAFSTKPRRLKQLAAQSTHLALIVAQNVATPGKLLQQLALSENIEIQIEVVKNPKTPEEILWKLGERFPRELLVNPLFDLLLLVNPNLLESIPYNTLKRLFLCDELPEYFRKIILTSNNDTIIGMRRNLAQNSKTPVGILKQLANDADEYVRYDVATNSNTPVEILQQLAHDTHGYVRYDVALQDKTPVETLKQLANDVNAYVRRCVAKNSNTPVEALKQLAHDPDNEVRRCVAKNSNTLVIWQQLAHDPDPNIRKVAVKRLQTFTSLNT